MTTLKIYAHRLSDANLNVSLKVTIANELRDRVEIFQAVEYSKFLETLIPVFIDILKKGSPVFVSNAPEQRLRNIILEIISRLPQTEHLKDYAPELCSTLVQLLRVENEDNAVVCVKIIFDLHRTFRQVLEDQVQPFLDIVKEVFQNMEQAVKDSFDAPSTPAGSSTPGNPSLLSTSPRPMSPASDQSESPAKLLPKGMCSFKVLAECPIIIILLFQSHRSLAATNITQFAPLIMHVLSLQAKPQAEAINAAAARGEVFVGVCPEIRNRSVYSDFMFAQVKTTSFLAYILRTYPNLLRPYQSQIPDNVIRLLRVCPPESSSSRKELLVATRHILATDFRNPFVPKLDLLLNEKVLIGTGVTSYDLLRPLAFSMLADLVHHIRPEITPAQLYRTVYIYTRNIHDATLAPSIQTMCGKLLLNLVDCATRLPNKAEARELLMRILDAFASKFEALVIQFPPCLKAYHKSLSTDADDDSEPNANRTLPILNTTMVADVTHDGIKEGRFLFKNLSIGLKPLYDGLRTCSAPAQSTDGNPPAQATFATGFSQDDIQVIVRLFRAGISCFEYFNVDNYDLEGKPMNAWPDEAHNDLINGTLMDFGWSKREQAMADKEKLDMFLLVFTIVDPAVFQEIFDRQMDFIFDRMRIYPTLIYIVQYFVLHETTSQGFMGILVHFLMKRLERLGDEDTSTALLTLHLFHVLFAGVKRYPETNEAVLLPYLTKLVMSCFKLSAKAKTPVNYFLVLRALFKSIGGGQFERLYKEMTPMLELLLENLNTLIAEADKDQIRNVYVELCLAIPVRLSALAPCLPFLMRPLVLALRAGPELVSHGLATLELFIDNLAADFLGRILSPAMKDLMEALCDHLRPHPYHPKISYAAIRVLGKLGGRNRSVLNVPPTLNYPSHAENGLAVDISFDSTNVTQKLGIDNLVKMAVSVLGRTDVDTYYKSQALEFLKSCIVFMFDLDTGSDDLASVYFLRIQEYLVSNEDHKSTSDTTSSNDNTVVGKALAEHGLKPQRLAGSGYSKYLDKRVAQEEILRTIVAAILRASAVESLVDEAWSFFAHLSRHFILVHIGETIDAKEGGNKPLLDMMDERLLVQHVSITLFVDAIVDVMSSESAKVQERAKKAVQHCYDTAAQLLSSNERAWQLPIFRIFASQFCAYCYKQEWLKKRGGCLGISVLSSQVDLGTRWMREHELEFVRALLFVLKDVSPDMPNLNTADATQTLAHVLKVCNRPEDEELPESQAKFQNLVALLLSELSNANSTVRETIQSSFQLLADLTGNEVTELLAPVRDRLVGPIFAKPLRALPFAMQIGHIDAIRYCLTLRPPLLEFNDELVRLLHETLALADAEDEALVGRNPKYRNLNLLVHLRIVCIKLLSAAMSHSGFPNQLQVVKVFFKLFHSKSPEVVDAAHRGLSQALKQKQKLPKEILQPGLTPVLTMLSKHTALNVGCLEGLARLLELLTNYFRIEIGKKLLDHLQQLAEPNMLSEAAGKALYEASQIKIMVGIVNIFHLLPPGADMYLDDLVGAVLKLESSLRRSSSSPFRQNLLKYLNRYASTAITYFYERLDKPAHSQLFVDLLGLESAGQLREELLKSPDDLIAKTFKTDQPTLASQGIRIVHAVIRYSPQWLVDHRDVLDCLLTLWRQPSRFERMKKDDQQAVLACRESHVLAEIFMAYSRANPQEVDILFDLLQLLVHESTMDLSFLRAFFADKIVSKLDKESRRKIMDMFLQQLTNVNQPAAMKAMTMRHLANPILATLFSSKESKEELDALLDGTLLEQLDSKVWSRMLPDTGEENQYDEDLLRIELIQMTAMIIQNAPEKLADFRKNVIKFGWNYLRRDDATCKQAAYVLIAYFIAAFETPSKIVIQIYTSLLRAHTSDVKVLVRQGLDILVPMLPKRVPMQPTERLPTWVRLTRRVIVEDTHSISQMANIYQLLVRHPDLFYDYREHFLSQMVNAIPKLGLLQNPTPEHKLLAVELAELILKWEKTRLANQPSMDISPPSDKRKADAEDTTSPQKKIKVESNGSSGDARAVPVEGTKEYAPPLTLCENLVGYLVRQACAVVNPKDMIQRRLVQRVIDVLKEYLQPDVWPDVHVKFAHLERILAVKEMPEAIVPSVCNALDVLTIDIAHKPVEWYLVNISKLHRLLETSIKSDNSRIITAMCPALSDIFRVIHQTSAAETNEQESTQPDVTAFISLVDSTITDSMANQDSMFIALKLLEATSVSRPKRLDSFVPSIVKIMQKLTKDMTSEYSQKEKADQDDTNLLLCLNLLKSRVSYLGDQRRWFLSCLAQLIEQPPSTEVEKQMLDMVRQWILERTETFPTMKEKAGLLSKMSGFATRSEPSPLVEEYLDLIIKIYNDPVFARSELTARLEQAFLLGTASQDQETRSRFMRLFDRSISRSLYNRIHYILDTQSWEPIGGEFWLHQALDLTMSLVRPQSLSMDPPSLKIKSIKSIANRSDVSASMTVDMPAETRSLISDHLAFLHEMQNYDTTLLITTARQLQYLDDDVAASLWMNLFTMAWSTLNVNERQELTKTLAQLLSKDFHTRQAKRRPNVIQVLLESIARADSVIKLPPHLVRHLGQTYDAWYTSIEILSQLDIANRPSESSKEDRANNERVLDALGELYAQLNETDMYGGLWRQRATYQETKVAMLCEQLGAWSTAQRCYEQAQINARSGVLAFTESEYTLWDEHWIQSTQKLEQWDILEDLAKHEGQAGLLMECAWRWTDWTTDRESIEQTLRQVADATSPRYRTFEALLTLIKIQNNEERLAEFERVWDEGIRMILTKWNVLPSIVTNSHADLLQQCQQFLELHEAKLVFGFLVSTTAPTLEQRAKELKLLLNTWRERIPNAWDDISVWSNLVSWRQHVFDVTSRTFLSLVPSLPASETPYSGCIESKWIINQFAKVARKQHLYDTCLQLLAKVDTVPGFGQSDMPQIFTKLKEMLKCHYDNPCSNYEAGNMEWNLSPFDAQQKADILTLKALFWDASKQYSNANDTFIKTLQSGAPQPLPWAWAQWGRYNDKQFALNPKDLQLANNAVSCYLQAAGIYKNHKSREFLLRVLWLLSLDDTNGTIANALEAYRGEWSFWHWITFIPQLLEALNHAEAKSARTILMRIAREYPQALHFQLRTALEHLPKKPKKEEETSEDSTPAQTANDEKPKTEEVMVKTEETSRASTPAKTDGQSTEDKHVLEEIMAMLKTGYPLLALSLETMVDQIRLKFKPQSDEDMYRLVAALYDEGVQNLVTSLVQPGDVESLTETFVQNIVRFAENLYPGHMKTAFMNDFAKESQSLEENVAKLRLWRDKFEAMLDARPRRQKLESLSHYLVEFQHRKFDDIEIPGQYLMIKDVTDEFLRIDRFMPEVDVVRRNSSYMRRLTIRAHDGSLHPFIVQNPAARQLRREERLMQLFRLLNHTLERRKESRQRRLAFHLPAIVPMSPNVRIVADNLTYSSLFDIYENHCDAVQMHRDDPLVYYVDKIKAQGQVTDELKVDTLKDLERMIPPNLLTQYLLQSMATYADFWLLRKQFTAQYATTTFLTLLFGIGNRTPHHLLVSKRTGCVWATELLPGWTSDTFELDAQETVPFRCTPTLREFMTPVGMDGLFVMSVISAARTLSSPDFDLERYLSLFVRDEYVAWANANQSTVTQTRQVVDRVVETIGKRATELACRHKEEGSTTDPRSIPANEEAIIEHVQNLIQQASDPQALADMGWTWMPWL